MLINEFEKFSSVKTPTVGAIAYKHNVTVKSIRQQLSKGIKVEKEHTTDARVAKEIALDHLAEYPDYYDRLEAVEEDIVPFPTQQARHKAMLDKLRSKSSIYNKDGSPTRNHPDLKPKEPHLKLVK